MEKGILYVVATPIGNLKDITLRALETLKSVDLVACEDTRVTGKLLHHLEIKKTLISFHQHSRDQRVDEIVHRLERGENIALATDSGTPGISDPGAKLVKAIIDSRFRGNDKQNNDKIKIVPIPGPSALTAALSVSGAASKNIVFFGFLPHKKGRNKAFGLMQKDLQSKRTVVFYESPYRIKKTLEFLKTTIPQANIIIAREMTKKFEEIICGKIDEVEIDKIMARGEFTVVVHN